jgi:hypothetical protein
MGLAAFPLILTFSQRERAGVRESTAPLSPATVFLETL